MLFKITLPPLPATEDEKFDFFTKVVSIVNRSAGCVAARIDDREYNVRVKYCCLLALNQEQEEYEFTIYDDVSDKKPIWRSLLSDIHIDSFSEGFWLELSSCSQPTVVLYIVA